MIARGSNRLGSPGLQHTSQPVRDAIRPSPSPARRGAGRTAAAPPGRPAAPGPWKLVLFLWLSAMVFLGLYEFLWALLRALFHAAR